MKTNSYQPEKKIRGDSREDTIALKEMARSARQYLESLSWTPPVKEIFLAYGVGRVVAVFLVQFSKPIGKDEFLWVIVGDLPSAYLVTDEISTPSEALRVYCDLMEGWSNAVRQKKSLADVFPVRTEATEENAKLLGARVKFLREQIIPIAEELERTGETSKK